MKSGIYLMTFAIIIGIFSLNTAYNVEPAGKLPTVWGALKTKF